MRASARFPSLLTPTRVAGVVLGLLTGACGEEPAPSRTDDLRLYAALTSNADPAACGQISDAGLRGECISMAASALAAAGDAEAADAACEAMEASFWRDECWFLVADQAVTRGPDVARRCGQAGRLRNQCLTHAFDRELAESRVELAGQGEAAFEADLTERFSAFVPGQRGARAAHVMVAGMIGERERGQPFHLGLCGDASAETCRDAFVLRVEDAVIRGACLGQPDPGCPSRVLSPMCEAEVRQPELAGANGLPTWAEDAEAPVQLAWERLCDPRQPPLSQGSPGAGP